MRASESDRAVACPASLVIIRTRPRSERADVAANWGRLVHHWAETGDSEPAWASESHRKSFAKKLLLSKVDREKWWPSGEGEHEVTFAIRLADAHLILFKGSRDGSDDWKKAFPPDEYLTGTIDWLVMFPERVAVVDDLKTGAWPVDEKRSKQLLSYGLVPWILAGRPLDFELVVSITQWPKYPLAGKPERRPHRVSGLDLMEHLDDLRWAVSNPEDVVPTDDGCRFCDSRPECPAWQQENN